MAVTFKIPSSPVKSQLEIDKLLGVDLTNTGANVSQNRSPNAPNIIRDTPGKVRKRKGFKVFKDLFPEFDENESCYVRGAYPLKEKFTPSDAIGVNRVKDEFSSSTMSVITANDPLTYLRLYEPFSESEGIYYYMTYTSTKAFKFEELPSVTFEAGNYKTVQGFIEGRTSYGDSGSFAQLHAHTDDGRKFDIFIYEMVICHCPKSDATKTAQRINGYVKPPEQEGDVFDLNKIYNINGNPMAILTDGTETVIGDMAQIVEDIARYRKNLEQTYKPGSYKFSVEYEMTLDNANVQPIIFTVGGHEGYDQRQAMATNIVANAEDIGGGISRLSFLIKVSDWTIDNIDIMFIFDKSNTSKGASYAYNIKRITMQEISPKDEIAPEIPRFVTVVGNKFAYFNGNSDYQIITSSDADAFKPKDTSRVGMWQNKESVYIADGWKLKQFNLSNNTLKVLSKHSEECYIPTITIAKAPVGGGTTYEPLNLLQPGFTEQFNSGNGATTFALSMNGLDKDKPLEVYVLSRMGEWEKKSQGSHFTVNYDLGLVTFTSSIVNPISGEDNVRITAYKTIVESAEKINKCKIGITYGLNGEHDRLFLSGNPDYPSYDWFSEYGDFTYFPDINYSQLGNTKSAIVGYARVDDYLVTCKDANDREQTAFIREGHILDNNNVVFRVVNSLQGEGAIAPWSFQQLNNEPLFLTKEGVTTITTQDVTGNKYIQDRSFFVNGHMLKQYGLEDAYSVVFNNMYFLFVNNKAYVLDGLQLAYVNDNSPYSTRQYECFYLTDIPAYTAWVMEDELWFGTKDGLIMRFKTEEDALETYVDEFSGAEHAIETDRDVYCCWETPDLEGHQFFKKKTFRFIAVKLKAYRRTGVTLYSQTRGIWTLIKRSKKLSNLIFAFSELKFSEFTFNDDKNDPVISSKLRVKKVAEARFRIENGDREPFGIRKIGFEYVESGNFKG